MKSAKTPRTSFTRDELRVLLTALSCTDHIKSSSFQDDQAIQFHLFQLFSLLQSGDACRHPVTSSDVVEQGGN
ncbi:MAG: hypothetical protein Q8Q50_06130 [Methylobacter sp.]|nr:hypothetical protein [Methylobacter sp.]